MSATATKVYECPQCYELYGSEREAEECCGILQEDGFRCDCPKFFRIEREANECEDCGNSDCDDCGHPRAWHEKPNLKTSFCLDWGCSCRKYEPAHLAVAV